MINSEQFLASFKAEWTSLVSSSSQMILDIYPHKRDWTSFMLGTGGFLTKVMERLNKHGADLEYRSEYYTRSSSWSDLRNFLIGFEINIINRVKWKLRMALYMRKYQFKTGEGPWKK